LERKELTSSPFIRGKIQVIQKKSGYRFNLDSILLAYFSKIKNNSKVIDLGTGSGILILLLNLKSKNVDFYAVEVQKDLYQIAKENFKINNIEVKLYLENVKNIKNLFNPQSFDYVITNPPFFKKEMSKAKNKEIQIGKAEIEGTLEDFIYASSYLLKNSGKLFLINNITRFSETVFLMKKYKIQPKRFRFVHPTINESATNFLVEGIKGGKESGDIVEKPLIVYKNPKEKIYTEEVDYILNVFSG
jgi:tRNA1(Val) A37 N6-methylase TrmN6